MKKVKNPASAKKDAASVKDSGPSFSAEFGPEFYHHSLRSCWQLVRYGG